MSLMAKRMIVALSAGAGIGLFDIWLSSSATYDVWDLTGPGFWFMFLNRVSIGFFVAIAGIVTIHPQFNFKMFPVRGAFVGLWLSIPMATYVFFYPTVTWSSFWIICLTGAVYGVIVDVIATKFAGDGKKLLHPKNG